MALLAVLCGVFGVALALASASPDVRSADVLSPTSAHVDFDGDGRLDSAEASCDSGCEIDITLSRRATVLRVDTSGPVRGLIAADVDDDGDEDVVILSRSGTIAILANDGQGLFSWALPKPGPPRPHDDGDHGQLLRAAHLAAPIDPRVRHAPLHLGAVLDINSVDGSAAWHTRVALAPTSGRAPRPNRGPPGNPLHV